MTLDRRANTILEYWFGDLEATPEYFEQRQSLWFWGEAETDLTIRERFAEDVELAARGQLPAWEESPKGSLALIILLDQFSMNLWRDQARCYNLSAQAIAVAQRALAKGWDWAVTPAERIFLYLPLEHSEALADQEQSVSLFRRLAESAPAPYQPIARGFLDYAVRHHRVVARFGRFPDRNDTFGRTDTAEEKAFLASDQAPF